MTDDITPGGFPKRSEHSEEDLEESYKENPKCLHNYIEPHYVATLFEICIYTGFAVNSPLRNSYRITKLC